MTFRLARATLEDVDTILAHEYRVTSCMTATWTREELVDQIKRDAISLISISGVLVGLAAVEICGTDGHIASISVHPDYQRAGWGRLLLNHALYRLEQCPRVTLLTHPDNTTAQKLYRASGFRVIDRKENCFGDGEPRLLMARIAPCPTPTIDS